MPALSIGFWNFAANPPRAAHIGSRTGRGPGKFKANGARNDRLFVIHQILAAF